MMQVAVIGAGPAGLVTARELLRHGAMPTVFEAEQDIGGVWVYQENSEDDPLGLDSVKPIYSSLYKSLCTNLPRDLMAFLDYTFDSKGGGEDDWSRYPHHSLVRTYLEAFSAHFNLAPHIRLNTRVTRLRKAQDWEVTSQSVTEEDQQIETFDAVIVCSGHYSQTRIPQLPGITRFTGEMSHSHNYREPSSFKGKRVALWGTSASGFDIANEINTVAKHVYWLGNIFDQITSINPVRTGGPSPEKIDPNGRLIVAGEPIEVDAFMFCTGYRYEFPFLQDPITVTDNWVHPLYQDIVSPQEPTLGFIGLPFVVVPFPMFEMQAKWFVRQLTGNFPLPELNEMNRAIDLTTEQKQAKKILKRHYHRLGDAQFSYYDQLATECAEPMLPDWFKLTWQDVGKAREADPVNYRKTAIPTRGPTICK